jgi:hypothetical protein
MGFMVGSLGYPAAWITVSVCSVTAGLLMTVAARGMRADAEDPG